MDGKRLGRPSDKKVHQRFCDARSKRVTDCSLKLEAWSPSGPRSRRCAVLKPVRAGRTDVVTRGTL